MVHAISGLLARAVMEERATGGRVVRVDPAVVSATTADDLAVWGSRAANIQRTDASRATGGQGSLAGGFTLLERSDQAGKSGGSEEEKVSKLIHLDRLETSG